MTTRRGARTGPAARRVALWAPLAAWVLAVGCIGLWRGDYYAGITNGGLEACPPFNFDVSIEEGGRLQGLAATTYPWGTVSWDVVGQITGRDIVLETRTQDPRVPDRQLKWRGQRNAISLDVTEEGSAGCPAPRTATLYRK